jgi:hypothetical protein
MVMARKAKVRGLDEAIDELFKNYEGALTTAMKCASEIARDDIEFKAKSCLWEYYENFQPGTGEPNIYNRTGHLENAFIPYINVQHTGKEIEASVGMGYWAFMLDGVYSGSNNWTPVEGSWVLDNYLKGIHPTTDGSSYPGAPYFPVFDPISPETKMEKYLNDYIKTFNNNVLTSFAKQLTRR